MAQNSQVRGVATSIKTYPCGRTVVRYHQTDIVSFNADTITLRTGGFHTATTIKRMNQASAQFGLGFHVSREAGVTLVRADGQQPALLADGLKIDRLPF